MLIRLFQQTARSSVGECLVRPFLGLFASFSFSSPAKRPARSTWPPAAGPRATSAPDARTIAVTRWWDEDAGSAPPVVTKCPRHRGPSFTIQDPADPLVLGGLSDDD